MRTKILIVLILVTISITLATCVSSKKQKWTDPSEFDHELSAFPLEGTHDLIPCESCHVAGQYRETPTRCQHCHSESVAHASDPISECQMCHDSTITWIPISFDHDQTLFQLRDSHAIDDCFICHDPNTFSGLIRNCVACHDDAHDGNYGSTCSVCHNAQSWETEIFNHAVTGFPLIGKHADLDCETCHRGTEFSGLLGDCFTCHLDDSPPDHFGPTCETCHSTTTWEGAIFIHTFFPIDRGDHRDLDCQECHTVKNNFREFSCVSSGCHPKAKMDDEHRGEGGYVYESRACYRCHPSGKEDD